MDHWGVYHFNAIPNLPTGNLLQDWWIWISNAGPRRNIGLLSRRWVYTIYNVLLTVRLIKTEIHTVRIKYSTLPYNIARVFKLVCVGTPVQKCECEIDAAAHSTSLTEESSGMEMDHMVSLVPDALALEKGTGWVWLRPDLPPLGWNGPTCTGRLLFVDCSLHVYLSVEVFASSSCVFLFALPVVFPLFLSLICLAWSWFMAGVLDIFQSGLFLITSISENWTSTACELHY